MPAVKPGCCVAKAKAKGTFGGSGVQGWEQNTMTRWIHWVICPGNSMRCHQLLEIVITVNFPDQSLGAVCLPQQEAFAVNLGRSLIARISNQQGRRDDLDDHLMAAGVWVHGQHSREGDHLAVWGQMLQHGEAMGTLVPVASPWQAAFTWCWETSSSTPRTPSDN